MFVIGMELDKGIENKAKAIVISHAVLSSFALLGIGLSCMFRRFAPEG
jgi:hypothetical protein